MVKFHVSSLYLKIKQSRVQALVYQFNIWTRMEVDIYFLKYVCDFFKPFSG